VPWLWGLLTKAFLFHGYWQFSFDGPRHALALGFLAVEPRHALALGFINQGVFISRVLAIFV
jgi:hypothetical protein